MASPHPSATQLDFARSLRHCLNRLMDDTLQHDLKVPALHMRIAIVELDDILDGAAQQPDTRHGDHRAA